MSDIKDPVAFEEASKLALYLHRKLYKNISPNFELCDSTAGIISQIDNMVCSLVEAQPEQEQKSKVDFQTLTEMGLKRLQVSDTLVLQESCAKSPTLIFAENGNVIEVIGYKKLLEIKSFVDEILNYVDTPQ